MNQDDIHTCHAECQRPICVAVREAVAAEREKLKHELLTLEKWRGMALAKDGDGRTVQEVQREAREAEREACAKLLDEMAAKDRLSNYYRVAALKIRERGAP
jgi:hypothetical protein